jgi:hypothetical protein
MLDWMKSNMKGAKRSHGQIDLSLLLGFLFHPEDGGDMFF